MKVLYLVAALTATAEAWRLDLTTTIGGAINFSSTRTTACSNFGSVGLADRINRARFSPATAGSLDPTKFTLYANKDCKGTSYSNGAGDFTLEPARTVRSYSVV